MFSFKMGQKYYCFSTWPNSPFATVTVAYKKERPWVYIINGFAYKFSLETVAACKAGSEKQAFHYVPCVLNVRRWEVHVGLRVYFWNG